MKKNMTRQEVCAYITEHLFRYVRYTKKNGELYFLKPTPTDEYPESQTNCECFGGWNFMRDWQEVVEKLIGKYSDDEEDPYQINNIQIDKDGDVYGCCISCAVDDVWGEGDNAGEAVCYAAVNYLKAVKK